MLQGDDSQRDGLLGNKFTVTSFTFRLGGQLDFLCSGDPVVSRWSCGIRAMSNRRGDPKNSIIYLLKIAV